MLNTFTLVTLLGQGAGGVVLKVKHNLDGRMFALKISPVPICVSGPDSAPHPSSTEGKAVSHPESMSSAAEARQPGEKSDLKDDTVLTNNSPPRAIDSKSGSTHGSSSRDPLLKVFAPVQSSYTYAYGGTKSQTLFPAHGDEVHWAPEVNSFPTLLICLVSRIVI